MEKVQMICFLLLCSLLPANAQHIETVPYGDFEHWTVRHIKESAIIGGEVKTLYVVGPDETIEGNSVYDYRKTDWASSNAYAKVSGVTKTSVTVEPDNGPSGKCAKLSTRFASCKVAGVVEINVLATGALYWGKMLEPVTGVKNPYAFMDWGIPFTKRPSALLLDYRAELPASGTLTKGTTFRQQTFAGQDPCQVVLLLQQRWEDADGNIHAKRVGTAVLRIGSTTNGWKTAVRIPVMYGDARSQTGYRSYMDLLKGDKALYALNSRGQKKQILEEDWAPVDAPVTHAVLQIMAGSHGAFIGEPGNTLWVDNVRLEYPQ
ncbi:MAG: PCMD domain-containing protein [Bacteroidales bacterium]|nr:PCMD domain-containing protein [Bacteroidales bacterium]